MVFFKDLLITYLITLSLEKKLLFRKKSGKSLEFWIQKFVRTLDIGRIEVACVTGAKRGGGGGGEEGEKRERGREVRSFSSSPQFPPFSLPPLQGYFIIDSTSTKNILKKPQEKTIKTNDAALL